MYQCGLSCALHQDHWFAKLSCGCNCLFGCFIMHRNIYLSFLIRLFKGLW